MLMKTSQIYQFQRSFHFDSIIPWPEQASNLDWLEKEFSQYYWQESFDGYFFVSQSRFDIYATLAKLRQLISTTLAL